MPVGGSFPPAGPLFHSHTISHLKLQYRVIYSTISTHLNSLTPRTHPSSPPSHNQTQTHLKLLLRKLNIPSTMISSYALLKVLRVTVALVSLTSLASFAHAATSFKSIKSQMVVGHNLPTSVSRDGVPLHGKWCGPGHSGHSESTSCIDALDCACKDHDLCYEKYGYLNCRCDNDFVKATKNNLHPTAIASKAYFASSPCSAPSSDVKWCQTCGEKWGIKVCTPK